MIISNFSKKLFIILFIYLFIYLFNLFIRVSKYSKSSCKIKKPVNNWRNSLKSKKYLYSPIIHIHKLFADRAIQTSKPKNIPNFCNQPHFFTKSLGHDWLIDLFQRINRLSIRKAITLNFSLSKPVSLGNCMLSRDATVSHKFSPLK